MKSDDSLGMRVCKRTPATTTLWGRCDAAAAAAAPAPAVSRSQVPRCPSPSGPGPGWVGGCQPPGAETPARLRSPVGFGTSGTNATRRARSSAPQDVWSVPPVWGSLPEAPAAGLFIPTGKNPASRKQWGQKVRTRLPSRPPPPPPEPPGPRWGHWNMLMGGQQALPEQTALHSRRPCFSPPLSPQPGAAAERPRGLAGRPAGSWAALAGGEASPPRWPPLCRATTTPVCRVGPPRTQQEPGSELPGAAGGGVSAWGGCARTDTRRLGGPSTFTPVFTGAWGSLGPASG